jgi:hypothetical protein
VGDPYNTADQQPPSSDRGADNDPAAEARARAVAFARSRAKRHVQGTRCGNCEVPWHLSLADLITFRKWIMACPRCRVFNRLPLLADVVCALVAFALGGLVCVLLIPFGFLGPLAAAILFPFFVGVARVLYLDRGKLVSLGY